MLYIDTQAKLHRAAMVVSAGRLHRAATVVSARRLHRAATVVKGLKLDLDLSVFADSNSEEGKWMAAGICFLSLLYGGNAMESLNDLRYRIFCNTKEPPKIKTYPPTDETAR